MFGAPYNPFLRVLGFHRRSAALKNTRIMQKSEVKPPVKPKELNDRFIDSCYMRKAKDFEAPTKDDPDCYAADPSLRHPRTTSALTAFAEVALKAKLKPFALGRESAGFD